MRELTLDKNESVAPLPPRRRLWTAVLAAAALLGIGWTTYALTRPVTRPATLACFETADLNGDAAIVAATGEDPVAVCERLWEEGAMAPRRQTPRLEACVLPTGVVGVFPATGGDTCEALGLGTLPPTYREEASRFADLMKALDRQIPQDVTGRCVGLEEAESIVRRELDARGFEDYRIEYHPDSWSERHCAGLSYDSSTVWLVPEERF